MSIRKRTKIWITKDGQKLRVCDMADRHLLNTLRLIARRYVRICEVGALTAYAYAYNPMTPDGASMAAEAAGDEMEENAETLEGIEVEFPIFKSLLNEAERRKLVWRPENPNAVEKGTK